MQLLRSTEVGYVLTYAYRITGQEHTGTGTITVLACMLPVAHEGTSCFHSCCGTPGRFESCSGAHGSLTDWCHSGYCGEGVCCQRDLRSSVGGPCDGSVGCDGHKCCTSLPQPRPPPKPLAPSPAPPPPPYPRAPVVPRCSSACGDRTEQCRYAECRLCVMCTSTPKYRISRPCDNEPTTWQFCSHWCKIAKHCSHCECQLCDFCFVHAPEPPPQIPPPLPLSYAPPDGLPPPQPSPMPQTPPHQPEGTWAIVHANWVLPDRIPPSQPPTLPAPQLQSIVALPLPFAKGAENSYPPHSTESNDPLLLANRARLLIALTSIIICALLCGCGLFCALSHFSGRNRQRGNRKRAVRSIEQKRTRISARESRDVEAWAKPSAKKVGRLSGYKYSDDSRYGRSRESNTLDDDVAAQLLQFAAHAHTSDTAETPQEEIDDENDTCEESMVTESQSMLNHRNRE